MMQTLEWSNTDKTEWPDGPWMAEPDKIQWQDETTGLPCLIVRGGGGALCGYVGVGQTHPWYGMDYNERTAECEASCDVDYCYTHKPESLIEVHGGLTFSGGCQKHGQAVAEGVCHVPAEGEPDNVWWFGFDTAHSGDIRPESLIWERKVGLAPILSPYSTSYKTIEYVRSEVTALAAQLAEVK